MIRGSIWGEIERKKKKIPGDKLRKAHEGEFEPRSKAEKAGNMGRSSRHGTTGDKGIKVNKKEFKKLNFRRHHEAKEEGTTKIAKKRKKVNTAINGAKSSGNEGETKTIKISTRLIPFRAMKNLKERGKVWSNL